MLVAMKKWLLILATCLALGACQSVPVREGEPAKVEIPNFMTIAPGIASGGQVEPLHFAVMKKQGYSTVINLRPDSEDFPRDEETMAVAAGLSYYQIPVNGAALSMDSAYALQWILDEAPDGHVLIHCRSGARVGAIWGLYQALENDLDGAAASDVAMKAGARKQALADQVAKLVDAEK